MVRPEYMQFVTGKKTCDYTITGSILAEYALGSRIQYEIELVDGTVITVEKLREERLDAPDGQQVHLSFDAANTHLIKDA